MKLMTQTTWKITETSHVFASKFPGRCALTGDEFFAGDQIRMGLINGQKGVITQRSLRLLDARTDGDMSTWTTSYVVGTAGLAEAINDPACVRVVVLNTQGKVVVYDRNSIGEWSKPGKASMSVAQMLAQTSKAVAWQGHAAGWR